MEEKQSWKDLFKVDIGGLVVLIIIIITVSIPFLPIIASTLSK